MVNCRIGKGPNAKGRNGKGRNGRGRSGLNWALPTSSELFHAIDISFQVVAVLLIIIDSQN